MAQINITLNTELLHGLFSKDGKDDPFSKLLLTILSQVLEAQSTEQPGAGPYEPTEEGFEDIIAVMSLPAQISREASHVEWCREA